MSEIPPMLYTWSGEALIPYRAKYADQFLVVGEKYLLVEHKERSRNSHSHFFAVLHEAWLNLPEDVAEHFQTSEALRKYALIKAGYCDSNSIVCASKAEAQRVAAFIKPVDEFAIVTVHEATVTRYTAKSQSMKAMGKRDFSTSKEAVLDIISAMVNVSKTALQANAGVSA